MCISICRCAYVFVYVYKYLYMCIHICICVYELVYIYKYLLIFGELAEYSLTSMPTNSQFFSQDIFNANQLIFGKFAEHGLTLVLISSNFPCEISKRSILVKFPIKIY